MGVIAYYEKKCSNHPSLLNTSLSLGSCPHEPTNKLVCEDTSFGDSKGVLPNGE